MMGWMDEIKRRVRGGMRLWRSCRCVAGGLVLSWGGAACAANEVTVNTDVLQGTCSIAIQSAGAATTTLPLGDIDSRVLSENTSMAGFTPVDLVLSGCGLSSSSVAPFVSLDASPQAQSTDVINANVYTFRDPGALGGSSHGYFIFVANSAVNKWSPVAANGTGDGVYGATLPIPMAAKGTSGEGARKTVYLGVGCYNECLAATTYGGTLTASMVFTFKYQ